MEPCLSGQPTGCLWRKWGADFEHRRIGCWSDEAISLTTGLPWWQRGRTERVRGKLVDRRWLGFAFSRSKHHCSWWRRDNC